MVDKKNKRHALTTKGIIGEPEPPATQSYGQDPAGVLTIGFEEQLTVWLAHHGSWATIP